MEISYKSSLFLILIPGLLSQSPLFGMKKGVQRLSRPVITIKHTVLPSVLQQQAGQGNSSILRRQVPQSQVAPSQVSQEYGLKKANENLLKLELSVKAPTGSEVCVKIKEKEPKPKSSGPRVVGGIPLVQNPLVVKKSPKKPLDTSNKRTEKKAAAAVEVPSLPAPPAPITGTVGRHLGVPYVQPVHIPQATQKIKTRAYTPRVKKSVLSAPVSVMSPALQTQSPALLPAGEPTTQATTDIVVRSETQLVSIAPEQLPITFASLKTQAQQAGIEQGVSCLIDQHILSSILERRGFTLTPGAVNAFSLHAQTPEFPDIVINPVVVQGVVPCIVSKETAKKLVTYVSALKQGAQDIQRIEQSIDINPQELLVIAPENENLLQNIQQLRIQQNQQALLSVSVENALHQGHVIEPQYHVPPEVGVEHGRIALSAAQQGVITSQEPLITASEQTTVQPGVSIEHGVVQQEPASVVNQILAGVPVIAGAATTFGAAEIPVAHGQTLAQEHRGMLSAGTQLSQAVQVTPASSIALEHGTAQATQQHGVIRNVQTQNSLERIRWVKAPQIFNASEPLVPEILEPEILENRDLEPRERERNREEERRRRPHEEVREEELREREREGEERERERERERNRSREGESRRRPEPRQRRFVNPHVGVPGPINPDDNYFPFNWFDEPENDDNGGAGRAPRLPQPQPNPEPNPVNPPHQPQPPQPPVPPTAPAQAVPVNPVHNEPAQPSKGGTSAQPMYQPVPYSEPGQGNKSSGTPSSAKNSPKKRSGSPQKRTQPKRHRPSGSSAPYNNYATPSWQPDYQLPYEWGFDSGSAQEKMNEGKKELKDTPWKKGPNAYGLPPIESKQKKK